MKKTLLFVCCALLFCLGFAGSIGWRVWHVKEIDVEEPEVFSPHPTEYMFMPPRQSLVGTVSVMHGAVLKFGRDDKEPQPATRSGQIVEGEKIITQPDGLATLKFADHAQFDVQPDSVIILNSTNPNNFLLVVEKGGLSLQTDVQMATVSARVGPGLFQVQNGEGNLLIDPETSKTIFSIHGGLGLMGYIDADNVTQTKEIKAGETIIFDDRKRLVKSL